MPETGNEGVAASQLTETRISWLTLGLGLVAGVLLAVLRSQRWGAGVAIGACLAWLNFRWMKSGIDGMVASSAAQADKEKPAVPVWSFFKMAFRYGLIGLTVYVIFKVLSIPLASMVVGLCALGAAVVAASVYEILRPTG